MAVGLLKCGRRVDAAIEQGSSYAPKEWAWYLSCYERKQALVERDREAFGNGGKAATVGGGRNRLGTIARNAGAEARVLPFKAKHPRPSYAGGHYASNRQHIILEYRLHGDKLGGYAKAITTRPETMADLRQEFNELWPTLAFEKDLVVYTSLSGATARVTPSAYEKLAVMKEHKRVFFCDIVKGGYDIKPDIGPPPADDESEEEEEEEEVYLLEVALEKASILVRLYDRGISTTVSGLKQSLRDNVTFLSTKFASNTDMKLVHALRELDAGKATVAEYNIPRGGVLYVTDAKKSLKRKAKEEDSDA